MNDVFYFIQIIFHPNTAIFTQIRKIPINFYANWLASSAQRSITSFMPLIFLIVISLVYFPIDRMFSESRVVLNECSYPLMNVNCFTISLKHLPSCTPHAFLIISIAVFFSSLSLVLLIKRVRFDIEFMAMNRQSTAPNKQPHQHTRQHAHRHTHVWPNQRSIRLIGINRPTWIFLQSFFSLFAKFCRSKSSSCPFETQ